MAKSFTDRERELIKKKLQECCEECWSKLGYRKTTVGELCSMAGISTGAFYLFYDSKEMLFVDTFSRIQERYDGLTERLMPENPSKYEFANVLKQIFHELEKMPWMLKLQGDLEIILRKLPPEFIQNNFKSDIGNLSIIIEKYRFKTNVSIDLLTSMFYILSMSIAAMPVIGEQYSEALDLAIDSIVEKYLD